MANKKTTKDKEKNGKTPINRYVLFTIIGVVLYIIFAMVMSMRAQEKKRALGDIPVGAPPIACIQCETEERISGSA